jgi:hypothetical protein
MQLLLPFAHVAIAKKGAFWIEAQKTAAPAGGKRPKLASTDDGSVMADGSRGSAAQPAQPPLSA